MLQWVVVILRLGREVGRSFRVLRLLFERRQTWALQYQSKQILQRNDPKESEKWEWEVRVRSESENENESESESERVGEWVSESESESVSELVRVRVRVS